MSKKEKDEVVNETPKQEEVKETTETKETQSNQEVSEEPKETKEEVKSTDDSKTESPKQEEQSAIEKIKSDVNSGEQPTDEKDKELKEKSGLELQVDELHNANVRLNELVDALSLRVKQLEESFKNLATFTDEDRAKLEETNEPTTLGNSNGYDRYKPNGANSREDLFSKYGTTRKTNFAK